MVTTCVVVWIEMDIGDDVFRQIVVTTCVVVWIEINVQTSASGDYRHHLRGGVD